MKELISVAVTGRSLGVHMILATQKPVGVVDATIWSNMRFRICLRMQDEQDSREVIHRPDASKIVQPGRAYLQIGDDEVFELIQSAYASARLNEGQVGVPKLSLVSLNGVREPIRLDGSKQALELAAPTQVQAIIAHIAQSAQQEKLAPLSGPWREPLPKRLPLTQMQRLPRGGWSRECWKKDGELIATAGMIDNPDGQIQFPLKLNFSQNGHMAIFGAPETGKKMLLTTIAVSLMLTYSPQELNLYFLDFGDRSSRLLEAFPQVGGAVLGDESERVTRLLHMLRRELKDRKSMMSKYGDGSILDYRRRTGEPLASMVLFIDEYAVFKDMYETLVEDIFVLSSEGAAVGIYVVLSAVLLFTVGTKLMANIKQAVSLHQNDRAAYAEIVGNTRGVFPEDIRGRGIARGEPPLIFQSALVAEDDERAVVFAALGKRMSEAAGNDRARSVPSMPDIVQFSDLLENPEVHRTLRQQSDIIALGIDMQGMMPVYMSLTAIRGLLIAAPMGGGKRSLLRMLIMSMILRRPSDSLGFVILDSMDMDLFVFKQMPHTITYATTDEPKQVMDALQYVKEIVELRRAQRRAIQTGQRTHQEDQREITIILRDVMDFIKTMGNPAKELLIELIGARALGICVVAAGSVADLGGYDPLLKTLRELQTGILIGAHVMDYATVFNVRTQGNERAFLPGEGYLMLGNGTAQRMRFAYISNELTNAWVDTLIKQNE